jgi:4-aminobutyrate aminotransferase-like enzyme
MPTNAELLARDSRVVIRGWENIAEPTPLASGKGVIVKDYEGKEYIDCSAGMFCVNVGHSHPAVIKAIQEQATRLIQISGHQTTEPTLAFAELLTSVAPGNLKRLYFTVGGTETVNVALKMAKSFSGKHEIIAMRNAYHGLHGVALACTGSTSYKKNFGPLEPGVRHAPHAYCYRCPFNMTHPACDLRCADEIEAIVKNEGISAVTEGDVGTVIVEPVQGRGGIVPPQGWLTRVREICTRNGLLMVVDEIMAGFGRTGKMWGCDHEGVVPDILAASKNTGGGIPSGAVLTRSEIADTFQTSAAPTFAGNALASAAGLAATKVIVEEKLWENAAAMGRRLVDGLHAMKSERFVGEARFKGLMGGLELVKDQKTKEPLGKKEMARTKEELLKRGVMVTYSGPKGNVFRIQPALVIEAAQIDRVVEAFDLALQTVVG